MWTWKNGQTGRWKISNPDNCIVPAVHNRLDLPTQGADPYLLGSKYLNLHQNSHLKAMARSLRSKERLRSKELTSERNTYPNRRIPVGDQ